MPEDIDDRVQEEGTDLVDRRHIRALEEKAHKADEYEARLTAMERENAFARALGTSTTEPWFPYFEAGYKGELDADAIREAATTAGFAKTAPAETAVPPTDQTQALDLAAHQRLAQASAGAAPPPPFDPAAEMAKASSPEELMAIVARCDPDKHGITGPIIT